jgi:hypothetical protein
MTVAHGKVNNNDLVVACRIILAQLASAIRPETRTTPLFFK